LVSLARLVLRQGACPFDEATSDIVKTSFTCVDTEVLVERRHEVQRDLFHRRPPLKKLEQGPHEAVVLVGWAPALDYAEGIPVGHELAEFT
jgi:hypothetical protein